MNETPPPLVSICIPTYNHERYIAQCLQSALMQSVNGPIEILVGDDLSSDHTAKIIREVAALHPNIIRYIRYTERKGAVGNLSFLINEARGKYIAHLDGDDFWLPGKLAAQLAFIEAHVDCPAVYTNAFCIHDDGTPAGIFTNYKRNRISIPDMIRRGNFLNHSSLFYRGSLKKIILSPDCNILDYSTHLNLAKHGDLGYLQESLTVYRVSSSSSILIHANDHVRELYWAALCDTQPPAVSALDLNAGMAEFMRSIFFRSLRLRSTHLLTTWWPRVLEKAPAGRTRLLLQAGWAIFRTGGAVAASWTCRKLTGNTMRVLYPR
ncbi:MAG TPA: glycosyltransferase [Halothiobacillus sp.]|jgi:glycosyltransferase involved in cell wall biosynthesis|nr:glycosyltransferase [Halothiobacillus sp.]HQS29762.1 glycosyltransferase [Halothiobacillus sp.]HUN00567.1 glycosyltransferase [Halothiobacillus sp.]